MDSGSIHFKSNKHDWGTPQEFFDVLNAEFNFTVDAAASVENAKCERFWTIQSNGLAQDWSGKRVWVNPPYGREISRWIEKAADSGAEVVVMLIPARTDTKAWHRHIFGKAEVRFLEGRLAFTAFGDKKVIGHNAPFPCAVVIWGKGCSMNVSQRGLPLFAEV